MEDINDADYMHAKRLCKNLEINNLGEYHDLYLKNDTLLLADVFENLRKNVFKNLSFRSCKISISFWISMTSSFKKTEVELELLTDIDMLLMVDMGICHAIHRYAKANNKYMKDCDKTKESPNLKYWNVNNLYGWAIPQALPVNKFEWTKDTSQFNEDFIKNYNEESDQRHFLEVDVQYPEKLHELDHEIFFT